MFPRVGICHFYWSSEIKMAGMGGYSRLAVSLGKWICQGGSLLLLYSSNKSSKINDKVDYLQLPEGPLKIFWSNAPISRGNAFNTITNPCYKYIYINWPHSRSFLVGPMIWVVIIHCWLSLGHSLVVLACLYPTGFPILPTACLIYRLRHTLNEFALPECAFSFLFYPLTHKKCVHFTPVTLLFTG